MQRVQTSLSCQFDGHHQSPIIGVCVNKECQNKRPFCVACQYQFHNTHFNDLKNFDDLQNWMCQNSQIVEKLKNYQNDLNVLVKKISILIQATQLGNIQENFQEMNLTNLHNSINKQITLWNDQSNMCNLLQEIFSTTIKNKIENICSSQQYSNNIIQLNYPNPQPNCQQFNQIRRMDVQTSNPLPSQINSIQPQINQTRNLQSSQQLQELNKISLQQNQLTKIKQRQQIRDNEEYIRDIEKQIKATKEERRVIEEKIKVTQEQNRGTQEQNRDIEEQIKATQEQNRGIKEQIRATQEQNRDIEEQNTATQEQNKDIEEQIRATKEQIKAIQEQIRATEDKSRNILEIQKELNEVEDKLNLLRKSKP